MNNPDLHKTVAYFSSEYAIEDNLPIYAGGLGVLSSDTVLEAQNQNVPLAAVGLMYTHGFVTQANTQPPHLDPAASGFEVIADETGQPLLVDIILGDRKVYAKTWQKQYGSVTLYLLDTECKENLTEDWTITHHLYDQDLNTRIKQQWVLGIGGVKLLNTLGIKPAIYHLNEGHTGYAVIGLMLGYLDTHPNASLKEAMADAKRQVVATKHTVLPGAGMYIKRAQLEEFIGSTLSHYGIQFEELFQLGTTKAGPDEFSTTKLLMDYAQRANGVSRIHVKAEKQSHPESSLFPITNGIYKDRWLAHNFRGADISKLTDNHLWKLHTENKAKLVSGINDISGSSLDPAALTVVWARRITPYKRPTLIFQKFERLAELIQNEALPLQIIIAGNANVQDGTGLEILEKIKKYSDHPWMKGRIVYVPGYSVATAKQLARGADIWLNTPVRGQEACGTSGMKASLNGALQMSTSDGWFDEVDGAKIGWVLPELNLEEVIYDTLSHQAVPLYYERDAHDLPTGWIHKMRAAIDLINENFTTARMLDEYQRRLYSPDHS